MLLKKILLIEDDEHDQQFFREAIDTLHYGIHCKTVNNGHHAITHLDAVSNYEMIFLDLNMPVMNGMDCLAVLKENEKYNHIPVVIFTTSSDPNDIRRCEKIGSNYFMRKPNTLKDLCSGLENIISLLN